MFQRAQAHAGRVIQQIAQHPVVVVEGALQRIEGQIPVGLPQSIPGFEYAQLVDYRGVSFAFSSLNRKRTE